MGRGEHHRGRGHLGQPRSAARQPGRAGRFLPRVPERDAILRSGAGHGRRSGPSRRRGPRGRGHGRDHRAEQGLPADDQPELAVPPSREPSGRGQEPRQTRGTRAGTRAWALPVSPTADMGRAGCAARSLMPCPGSLAATTRRQIPASSSSLAPCAWGRAGCSRPGRTGSCGPARRRSAGPGRRSRRTAGSPSRSRRPGPGPRRPGTFPPGRAALARVGRGQLDVRGQRVEDLVGGDPVLAPPPCCASSGICSMNRSSYPRSRQ